MTLNPPKLLFIAALAGLFGVLMSLRFLDVFGIAPNLFLALGLLLLSLPAARKTDSLLASKKSKGLILVLTAIAFFLFTLTVFNFWSHYMLVLFSILIFCYVIKSFLTGNLFIDYIVLILVGTILFYFISGALFGTSLFHPVFLIEAVYNIVVGLLLWAVLTFLARINVE